MKLKFRSISKASKVVGIILSTALMLVLFAAACFGACPPLVINDGLNFVKIGSHIEYMEDRNRSFNIEQITEPDTASLFSCLEKDSEFIGYSKSVWWLRIKTKNQAESRRLWYLELDCPSIDNLSLYLPAQNGFTIYKTGDSLPFATRPIPYRTFVFPVDQPSGEYTLYFKIESAQALSIVLNAWSLSAFEKKKTEETPFLWIYCGIMIALFLYNLIIFAIVREKSYLYLIIFIFSVTLFFLSKSGTAHQYLWPDSGIWPSISLPFFVCVMTIGALLFTRSFLNTRINLPTTDKIILTFIICYFGIMAISVLLDYSLAGRLCLLTGPLASSVMFSSGVLSLKTERKAAVLYLFSWSFFFVNIISYVSRLFGVLPDSAVFEWGHHIGSFLPAFFLSLGLVDKIDIMRRQREKALEALKESEEKYRILVENSNEGIVLIIDEFPVFANKTLIELSGYTEQEFYSKSIFDFFPDTEMGKPLLKKYHRNRLEGKPVPFRYETQVIRKNGDVTDMLISSAIITIGKEIGTISILTDITIQKRAEEALCRSRSELENRVAQRTADLEEANAELKQAKAAAEDSARARSEFLANMSHEIRTPMNAIIGMCDLALSIGPDRRKRDRRKVDRRQHVRRQKDRLQQEYLNIVRTSSRSLLELINDILDFSKIEAGKLEFENIPFFIREVIEEIGDLFLEKMSRKEIEMVVDIAQDVPQRLNADPLRLRQILVNLVSNAFKFTESGEIHISVTTEGEYEELEQVSSGSDQKIKLKFCVRDTGIGIPAQHRNRLFDAFIQADGSMTRKYGGTGLGLGICKRIVEVMGGEIWFESEEGKGTSFYFTAPFNVAHDETEVEMTPENFKNMKVLVVEDNPSAQLVLIRFLESFGCKPESAYSAEEALDLYDSLVAECKPDEKPFDLIIMDVKLPGLDGISAAMKIKADTRIVAPPVIINTAFGGENEIHRAREAGIESYLVKPVKQSLLFDTMMEMFGYHSRLFQKKDVGLACPEEFSGINLLLVEDHPVNRRVATEIFKMAGINVDTVFNGIEALESVQSENYDIVLMDVQMPEMDGIQATSIIREKLGMKSLPIIAMTAHAMSGDRKKCLEAGMDDYVAKPIDRKELFAALRRNLKVSCYPEKYEELSNAGQEKANFDFPGLDIEQGVERTGGSWPLYLKNLQEFCSLQENFSDKIRQLVESVDFVEVDNRIYTLKKAADNIAAIDLSRAAKKLKSACKTKDFNNIFKKLAITEDALSMIFSYAELIFLKFPKQTRMQDVSMPGQTITQISGMMLNPVSGQTSKKDENLDFPGLDIEDAKNRFADDLDLYADILREFCEGRQNFGQIFRGFMENMDFTNATNHAHSLKGASGNVSAIDLYKAAVQLEKICQKNDSQRMADALDQVEKQLYTVFDSSIKLTKSLENISLTDQASDKSAAETGPQSDFSGYESDDIRQDLIEAQKILIQDLNRALEDFDPITSKEIMDKLKKTFPGSDTNLFQSLDHEIRNYLFDEAKETLKKIEGLAIKK
ncbi:response regulator [Desulfobacterales bacterium HSG16]|nr:response regulator [Desulfobacterales bacterium HSG16]